MDYSADIYELSKIPESIVEFLEDEYTLISKILNVSSYLHEHTDIEYFYENIDEYPPDHKLLQKTIKNITNKEIEEVEEIDPEDKIYRVLFYIRVIIGEQLIYIEDMNNNDKK